MLLSPSEAEETKNKNTSKHLQDKQPQTNTPHAKLHSTLPPNHLKKKNCLLSPKPKKNKTFPYFPPNQKKRGTQKPPSQCPRPSAPPSLPEVLVAVLQQLHVFSARETSALDSEASHAAAQGTTLGCWRLAFGVSAKNIKKNKNAKEYIEFL